MYMTVPIYTYIICIYGYCHIFCIYRERNSYYIYIYIGTIAGLRTRFSSGFS